MGKKVLFAVVLSMFFIMAVTGLALASCTSFIAGKNATADGSVMALHNEDQWGWVAQRVEVFPSKKHAGPPQLLSGPIDAWVGQHYPHKYKVIQYNSGWPTPPSDPLWYYADNPALINEFGVTVWDNFVTPRKELLAIEAKAVNLVQSMELKRIPLERAKTAREAVKILGYLVDTYGYMRTGMAYGISDPKEGWIVEVTKGKHWVAHRVPDDMVVFRSNCYRIQKVNLSDPNFMGSADLISYAKAQGWWTGSPSDFNFSQAYGDPLDMSDPLNTLREWAAVIFLDPRYHQLDLKTFFPWVQRGLGDAIVPLKKITLEDAMAFARIHYEGTPYDLTNGYKNGSPHWTTNECICMDYTESSTIVQLRDWLPLDIGCVLWRADGSPCSSVYIPWYLGITTTPIEFRTGTNVPSDDSAWWVFRRITNTIDAHYGTLLGDAKTPFSKMEKDLLAAQVSIENAALELYEKHHHHGYNHHGQKFLTDYCSSTATAALDLAKKVLTNLIADTAGGSWLNPVCPAP